MSNEYFAKVRATAELLGDVVASVAAHRPFVVGIDDTCLGFFVNEEANGIPSVAVFLDREMLTVQLSVEREDELVAMINCVLAKHGYGELFEEE